MDGLELAIQRARWGKFTNGHELSTHENKCVDTVVPSPQEPKQIPVNDLESRIAALEAQMSALINNKPSEPDVDIDVTVPISLREIRQIVAKHFAIPVSDFDSNRRGTSVCYRRFIAIHLCRKYTGKTISFIANVFGKRDHTTILHALKRAEELTNTSPSWNNDCEEIERIIQDVLAKKAQRLA